MKHLFFAAHIVADKPKNKNGFKAIAACSRGRNKKSISCLGASNFFSRSRRTQMTGRNIVSLYLNALRYN
jgi:hypothetical protein